MKVAIVGGSGKMGQWFARFLLKEGHQVVIIGRHEGKLLEVGQRLGVETATNVAAVKQADVILVSVPIDSFEPVIKQIAPHTRQPQIILDITSVKVLPVEAMHKHITAGTVLGTHPVFGPGAKGFAKQNLVLTPTNRRETSLAKKLKCYLEQRGARVTLMSPQEHDEMMAVVLGLAHFISIVSADVLLSLDRFREMKAIGGTTYRVLLTLIESVISEDPELYASLQMSLPHMGQIQDLFQRQSELWAGLVRSRDREEFVRRMSALRGRLEELDPDFGQAYANMYRLLEG